jgi:hypothetical protein
VKLRGEVVSTIDVYDGGFALFTGPDNSAWASSAGRLREELGIPLSVWGLGADLIPVDETVADLLDRYGLEAAGAGALLIRPDGFVGFRSPSRPDDEYSALKNALSEILDLARIE